MRLSIHKYIQMPNAMSIALGILCICLSGCASTKRGLSGAQVINQIIGNECAGSRLDGTTLLVTLWTPDKKSHIYYPEDAEIELRPETDVQIGGLTSSFFVPKVLVQLEQLGLSLDSTAIAVQSKAGHLMRNITYGQLLMHHSDLPVYAPRNEGEALSHLLILNDLLVRQAPNELTGKFRFTHWNYTLAAEAIRSAYKGKPDLRARLAYSDRLPDSVKINLAETQARIQAPIKNQHPALFALSTAGIASTNDLVGLLDSLNRSTVADLPEQPTFTSRPRTKVIPGWYKIYLKNGQHVYLNGGRTRRHSASVVYYPYTQTGVIAVATDSKQLDCLVLDILRNYNDNWKRKPASDE